MGRGIISRSRLVNVQWNLIERSPKWFVPFALSVLCFNAFFCFLLVFEMFPFLVRVACFFVRRSFIDRTWPAQSSLFLSRMARSFHKVIVDGGCSRVYIETCSSITIDVFHFRFLLTNKRDDTNKSLVASNSLRKFLITY